MNSHRMIKGIASLNKKSCEVHFSKIELHHIQNGTNYPLANAQSPALPWGNTWTEDPGLFSAPFVPLKKEAHTHTHTVTCHYSAPNSVCVCVCVCVRESE